MFQRDDKWRKKEAAFREIQFDDSVKMRTYRTDASVIVDAGRGMYGTMRQRPRIIIVARRRARRFGCGSPPP
jgi:UDP-N-acetylglucosamine transferase subunit ALG13